MTESSQAFKNSSLGSLSYKTPYFLFDESVVIDNLNDYRAALPQNTEICFAMKANSEKAVLGALNKINCSFEVASTYELNMLKDIGVSPSRILFGTAVKPENSIKDFFDYGVKRYSFDSEEELHKIARQAPGAKVYARVLVNDEAHSVFTMSEKFGTDTGRAVDLLIIAQSLGLEVYGLSFNVGSQARNIDAWANGLRDIGKAMEQLKTHGIEIKTINLGGGFPFSYQEQDDRLNIINIGQSIQKAVQELPYAVNFLAEPGRALVANAYVLVVSVFAKNDRPTGNWLYVDAGAYNALLETMAYQGSIRYKVDLLRNSQATLEPFVLTGPTGDSLDVIDHNVMLPSDIAVGDKIVVHNTGAYSFTLTTPFNGFPAPKVYSA